MRAVGDGPPPFTAIRIDGGAPVDRARRLRHRRRDRRGSAPGRLLRARRGRQRRRRSAEQRHRQPRPADGLGADRPHSSRRRLRQLPGPARRRADRGANRRPAFGTRSAARAGSGCGAAAQATASSRFRRRRRRMASCAPAGTPTPTPPASTNSRRSATTRPGMPRPRPAAGTARRWSSRNPLKAATALVARLSGQPSKRIVPYGRGIRLSGRLTAGIRSPLAGDAGADRRALRGRPRSGGRGSRPSRPSRAGATRSGSRPARVAKSRRSSPGSPTLQPVRQRFAAAWGPRRRAASGIVSGRPRSAARRSSSAAGSRRRRAAIPPGGKAVQLQFRLPGLPWTEFRTVQTDGSGRFRYAYRFSDDDSRGVRFQFRAYAPAQDGWPYEPAGSRPVIVRGLSEGWTAERARRRAARTTWSTRPCAREALAGRKLIALRTRCSTSVRLRFRVVSTVRCRLRASRSTLLRVLRASVAALRRAVVPRRSVRLTVRRSWVR